MGIEVPHLAIEAPKRFAASAWRTPRVVWCKSMCFWGLGVNQNRDPTNLAGAIASESGNEPFLGSPKRKAQGMVHRGHSLRPC